MKRILFSIATALAIGGLATGYYLYNKPHRNIGKSEVDYMISLDSLAMEFQSNQQTATNKYSGKVIVLQGKFGSMSGKNIMPVTILLQEGGSLANCELDTLYGSDTPAFNQGDELSVKGLFVGYDELLGEIQLKKCLLVN